MELSSISSNKPPLGIAAVLTLTSKITVRNGSFGQLNTQQQMG